MLWLLLGLGLWSGAHLLRCVAPSLRNDVIARLGADPYRGLFSLTIIASIALMVVGWRSMVPTAVYAPPLWGGAAAPYLMLAAMTLFAASGVPTNLKRLIRHPQLTGVVVWSFAHLLANGDSRSTVLFAGIGTWAIAEMVLINRREGAWRKPAQLPLSVEIKPLVGGIVAFAILYFAHPYLFGVSPG